jgi:hypothetical protein
MSGGLLSWWVRLKKRGYFFESAIGIVEKLEMEIPQISWGFMPLNLRTQSDIM